MFRRHPTSRPADEPPEPGVPRPAPAALIAQADALWTAPRAGEAQPGVGAVFGGFPPAALIGVRLWPVLVTAVSGPALVLTDIRRRVHAVVDVAVDARPGWVAAAAVSYGARMAGSAELWLHWSPELRDAPHDLVPSCEAHQHLPRRNAHGQFVTAVPQHDAWVMSRSWLPRDLVVPSVSDVRWVVLSTSDRPPRDQEPLVRSRWDVVPLGEFAAVLTARLGDPPVGIPSALCEFGADGPIRDSAIEPTA